MKKLCGQMSLKNAGIDKVASLFTAGLLGSFTMQISIVIFQKWNMSLPVCECIHACMCMYILFLPKPFE